MLYKYTIFHLYKHLFCSHFKSCLFSFGQIINSAVSMKHLSASASNIDNTDCDVMTDQKERHTLSRGHAHYMS